LQFDELQLQLVNKNQHDTMMQFKVGKSIQFPKKINWYVENAALFPKTLTLSQEMAS